MFHSRAGRQQGQQEQHRPAFIPPPVEGLRADQARAAMSPSAALVLDNWLPYPNRIEMRAGSAAHVTGFGSAVKGLFTWNGPSSSKLFATCDNGVFDATSAGAVGAAATAWTNGVTQGVNLATGAGSYLLLVNGTDSLKHYNGTTWTSVATFGSLTSSNISALEVYKQRLFFLEKNSMNLWYLPTNSISGSATSFPLGAIFRRGGNLAAIATWTVDSGTGPDDLLAVASSEGEVAIFAGTDPSTLATWSYRGVYFLGRPLGGARSLYKNGGSLLFLCENGLYPVARALQSSVIDKQLALTDSVQALFTSYAALAPTSSYWAMIAQPDIPALIVNIPGVGGGRQLVMNNQSRRWCTFSGWDANCFARMGSSLYYGDADSVVQALTGAADQGSAVVATALWAYSTLGPRKAQIVEIQPIFQAEGAFNYTIGVDNDFANAPSSTLIPNPAASIAVWGTAVWGAAQWSGPVTTSEWQTVPDTFGRYKAAYLQVSSSTVQPTVEGMNALYIPGGSF